MYSEAKASGRALYSETETCEAECDDIGAGLRRTRNTLDSLEEIVAAIENRIHGARPAATLTANQAVGIVAPEPGLLRLASDNAARISNVLDRLCKVNASL